MSGREKYIFYKWFTSGNVQGMGCSLSFHAYVGNTLLLLPHYPTHKSIILWVIFLITKRWDREEKGASQCDSHLLPKTKRKEKKDKKVTNLGNQ